MQIQQGTFCPLVQGECKKFECMFFTEVHGTNPNTGQPVNEWNCAIALMPMQRLNRLEMRFQIMVAH